ncbi:hypothetical protein RZS08_18985, partial [Arthrospira platensis SPKY1]|nr:hypothetical protein [Arthrospira platensis SPKY1]
ASLRLINPDSSPADVAAVYFNAIYLNTSAISESPGFRLEHVSGDVFRFVPESGNFTLDPSLSLDLRYSSSNILLKNSHRPKSPYWVDAEGAAHDFVSYSGSEITLEDQAERLEGSTWPLPTAERLYRQNAQTPKPERIIPITPSPMSYEQGDGFLAVG